MEWSSWVFHSLPTKYQPNSAASSFLDTEIQKYSSGSAVETVEWILLNSNYILSSCPLSRSPTSHIISPSFLLRVNGNIEKGYYGGILHTLVYFPAGEWLIDPRYFCGFFHATILGLLSCRSLRPRWSSTRQPPAPPGTPGLIVGTLTFPPRVPSPERTPSTRLSLKELQSVPSTLLRGKTKREE